MVTLEPRDAMRATMKVGEPFKRRALGAVLALPVFLVLYVVLPPSASDIMDDFYLDGSESGRFESMIADPLKNFPHVVKFHVIKDIANKNMKYRTYAMGFLGHCKIREALPALLTILRDETENSIDRGYALRNIFRIDNKQGLTLAEEYKGEKGFLGYMVERIFHPYE